MNDFLQKAIKNMNRTECSTTYMTNIGNRMRHAIMGIAEESGELIEILLQATFYNKPLDVPHYKDELGDLLWYLMLAIDDLAQKENRTTDEIAEEILAINSAKLHIRYPEEYSDEQAKVRDLKAEKNAVDETAN